MGFSSDLERQFYGVGTNGFRSDALRAYLASPPAPPAATVAAFSVVCSAPPLAAVGSWANPSLTSTALFGMFRQSSGVNASITYGLGSPLTPGTWSLTLSGMKSPSSGDWTVDFSADGSTWYTGAVFVGYNASLAALYATMTATVPVSVAMVRLTVATKTAPSSGFNGQFSALQGVRTGP